MFIKKTRGILSSTRGISLLEGIVSILIFTVLIAAITLILSTAMRITAASLRQADEMQNTANATLSELPGSGTHTVIFNVNAFVDNDTVPFFSTPTSASISIYLNQGYVDGHNVFVTFAAPSPTP